MEWIQEIKFNGQGLVPAIAQEYNSGHVLMLAYMDQEALEMTITTGFAHYHSRSRGKLWKKGETSGNTQAVRDIRLDCDKDTILLQVEQIGPACHTGAESCFFHAVDGEGGLVLGDELMTPSRLMKLVHGRREKPVEGSYTNYLFDKGLDKILKKLGEETTEVVIAAKNLDSNELCYEISDLIYHLTVLMTERGLSFEEVYSELARRNKPKK